MSVELSPKLLIEEVVASLEPMAAAKQLAVTCDVSAAPAGLVGDEGKIRQILVNLLSNAVKFTERGGVHVAFGATPDTWQFSVRDTGIGIGPEHQTAVFEEFHQIDASSTRQAGGTGLGFATCQRMAALMGGRMELVSALGEGSTFTLRIPAG